LAFGSTVGCAVPGVDVDPDDMAPLEPVEDQLPEAADAPEEPPSMGSDGAAASLSGGVGFALHRSVPRREALWVASDVVWRHDGGAIVEWHRAGITQFAGSSIAALGDPAWSLRAVGDLNGDGFDDFVWRHTSGVNAIWFRDASGAIVRTTTTLPVDPVWTLAGSRDFDGDGFDDLFWHHPSGPVVVWLMQSEVRLGAATLTGELTGAPAPWTLVGVGDVDGNGSPDLVWHNPPAAAVVVWYMQRDRLQGAATLSVPLDGAWTVVGVGSVDNDPREELQLRHVHSNQLAVWELEGSAVRRSVFAPSVPAGLGWTPIGIRRRGMETRALPLASDNPLRSLSASHALATVAGQVAPTAAGASTVGTALAVVRPDGRIVHGAYSVAAIVNGTTQSLYGNDQGPFGELGTSATAVGVAQSVRGMVEGAASSRYAIQPSGEEDCSVHRRDHINAVYTMIALAAAGYGTAAGGGTATGTAWIDNLTTFLGSGLNPFDLPLTFCNALAAGWRYACCTGGQTDSDWANHVQGCLGAGSDLPTSCECPEGRRRRETTEAYPRDVAGRLVYDASFSPRMFECVGPPDCIDERYGVRGLSLEDPRVFEGRECVLRPGQELVLHGSLTSETYSTRWGRDSQNFPLREVVASTWSNGRPLLVRFGGTTEARGCVIDTGKSAGSARYCGDQREEGYRRWRSVQAWDLSAYSGGDLSTVVSRWLPIRQTDDHEMPPSLLEPVHASRCASYSRRRESTVVDVQNFDRRTTSGSSTNPGAFPIDTPAPDGFGYRVCPDR
jgi:hypothetical protein